MGTQGQRAGWCWHLAGDTVAPVMGWVAVMGACDGLGASDGLGACGGLGACDGYL